MPTNLHLVLWLRMHGDIHPLPYMTSLHDAWLMNRDSFTFGEQGIANLKVLHWYKNLGSHRSVAEDSSFQECYTSSLGKQLPTFYL